MLRSVTVAAFVAAVSAETSVGGTSRLMVRIPHSLDKPGGYDHREATFGVPPYGGSISQPVVYADSTFCTYNAKRRGGYPKFITGDGTRDWEPPFILMIDRGECTFVEKVRNAQHAGAAGVIIADNMCLCSDDECMQQANNGNSDCESAEPIMHDDGSGGDVSIPSFLMFKHDADAVKLQLTDDHPVQIEMVWSLPAPDDRVEYELWFSVADPLSQSFLVDFKDVAKSLGESAQFTPHMYFYDGEAAGCRRYRNENECGNLCTNNGRYCTADPDDDMASGVSGADVVRESLRRICVWDYYSKDGIGEAWWKYVAEFDNRCNNQDFFTSNECIADCFTLAGIDADQVESCISYSGGIDTNVPNTYLEKELAARLQQSVVVIPTAFVNNAPLHGRISAATLFAAICNGFAEGTQPSVCNQCQGCSNIIECVRLRQSCSNTSATPLYTATQQTQNVSTHTFALSIISVIGTFIALGFWHYNKTRQDMREQVRSVLSEYMPLEDSDNVANMAAQSSSSMGFNQQRGTQSLI